MSAVKERILGAITVMHEEDAVKIWNIIKLHFSFSDEMPTEEEKAVIHAYKSGDADYQPFTSHEELKRELGL